MKKICSKGFKISTTDQKALDNYLLVTPLKWSQDALAGMINKAVKLIMKAGFESYKKTITGNISADYAVIIPGILSLPGFKLNKIKTPEPINVKRKSPPTNEIWPSGFDVEDYEEDALNALYEDTESILYWFMENKIYQRRKAFLKEKEVEFINAKKSFPSIEDDFIEMAVNEPGYKNRKARDKETSLFI